MPAGRPTKATPDNVAKAREYLATYKELGKNIPTVEGLALYLDVSRETLYARPEFSDTLRQIEAKQKEELVQNGLTGDFNPQFTKFLLSANHGLVEKSATDVTTKGKELPTPILGGLSNALQPDDRNSEASQA